HSLHVVADLTLASREHARFKQTDADVASFDGGFGSAYLARQVGQKFAREIFFLGDEYDAVTAHRMGLVNDGLVGQQLFAGEATRLAYGTDEAAEGRDAFLEKRTPDWSAYPWYY